MSYIRFYNLYYVFYFYFILILKYLNAFNNYAITEGFEHIFDSYDFTSNATRGRDKKCVVSNIRYDNKNSPNC